MTYLSPLKLAIVIVVGSMWMGLSQVVSDFPFVVNLVIVGVIATIGLNVARFVTQVVTVEVIIDAAGATIVATIEVIIDAAEATIEAVINAAEATIVAVEATIVAAVEVVVNAAEATIAAAVEVATTVVMAIIVAVATMVTILPSIDHKLTCLSPMCAYLYLPYL